jgi:hypothetical protein
MQWLQVKKIDFATCSDADRHENDADPQHWLEVWKFAENIAMVVPVYIELELEVILKELWFDCAMCILDLPP